MKRICSEPEQLLKRLSDLESWLVKRGYKSETVKPEIERVINLDRALLLRKQPKEKSELLTLVLTYHPALSKVHDILKTVQRHVEKSVKLKQVLPTPPRLAFRNPKTLRDKLVRSKLKTEIVETGNFKCGNPRCKICEMIDDEKYFVSIRSNKKFIINFRFDCNSQNVIYLLTCKVCTKQYVGSTTTKFRLRLNQYKSNLKLYGEGKRGFQQDSFLEHFFDENHSGSHTDLRVQMIDYCDANDPERREAFWFFNLNTMHPDGLNHKKAQ